MIYGIKSTVENLHSKYVSKILKDSEIQFIYASIGAEPTEGCDVFLDPKDETHFIYIKTENPTDQTVLKNTVISALENYNSEEYYPT